EENATEESSEETTENVNTNEYKEANSDDKSVCYPEYIGDAYFELNDNNPLFTDEEKKSTTAFEEYSDLDKLGRCGVAFANICPELMPTEERGEIGSVKPSGWHTVKYPEIIEDNYLYNRSHLIAYSLAGENANEKNLITGTRYLNQETMQIFELRVLDYVRDSGNHVLYRVTPVFEADNLLASGVQMEAWSVEDSGKGICFNVFCYNVQPGIDIDYATGDSRVAEEASSESKVTEDTNVQAATESTTETTVESSSSSSSSDFADQERTYILNTNTKKVHLPDCRSVKDMADHNKEECVGTLNDIKNKGYTPCKRCLAQY
ncbi:MAG: DNA/RNA non-specific endonuclease, partial [Eubacterium sp.]|nr:DNA/RNA non-specific endonuclease [Eubacterium sp.]